MSPKRKGLLKGSVHPIKGRVKLDIRKAKRDYKIRTDKDSKSNPKGF